MLEVYPETVAQLSSEAFSHVIGTLDFGLQHQVLDYSNCRLQFQFRLQIYACTALYLILFLLYPSVLFLICVDINQFEVIEKATSTILIPGLLIYL